MLHNSSIFLFLLIISSTHLHGASMPNPTTQKPPLKPSILSEINNDTEICDTPKIAVLQSNYVSKCGDVPYSSKNIGTPLNNTDAFLCLGLYDRAYQMCHSRSLNLELQVLKNSTAFESMMIQGSKNESNVLLVCLSFETNMREPLYVKTNHSVIELSKTLKDPRECLQICLNEKTRVINPLCLIMQLIDKNIQKEELERKAAETAEKSVEPEKKAKENEKEKETGSKKENDVKMIASKIGTNSPSQNRNMPSNPSQMNSPLQLDGNTENTGEKGKLPLNDAANKKDGLRNESKAIISSNEDLKNQGKDKDTTSQGQSPLLSTEQVTKKGDGSKKGASPEANEGDSVSQIAPPGKNSVEEKSSTVSENTGNGDFDPAMENNYDSGFHDPDGVPPGMDPDDDINSPPLKEVNSIKEKVPDSFQEANNVPKPPRLPDDDDSHFFGYFTIFGFLAFSLFLAYHHKHKIFAMLLEGRRSRGGRARRRPSTANYRKLDCTLEEAVTSQCSSNVTHVIY